MNSKRNEHCSIASKIRKTVETVSSIMYTKEACVIRILGLSANQMKQLIIIIRSVYFWNLKKNYNNKQTILEFFPIKMY